MSQISSLSECRYAECHYAESKYKSKIIKIDTIFDVHYLCFVIDPFLFITFALSCYIILARGFNILRCLMVDYYKMFHPQSCLLWRVCQQSHFYLFLFLINITGTLSKVVTEQNYTLLNCVIYYLICIHFPGSTKGGIITVPLTSCLTGLESAVWQLTTDNFGFYLQNRLIQTSQTGGQRYSDTSPFIFPAFSRWLLRSCVEGGTSCISYIIFVYLLNLPSLIWIMSLRK